MRLVAILLFASIATAQTPVPNQTGRIEGQVRSSDGQPLAGATLTLTPTVSRTGFRSTTDEQGSFVLQRIPPGAYSLQAAHPGYLPASQATASTQPRGPRDILRLELTAGAVYKNANFQLLRETVISGQVRDVEGKPVTDRRITVLRKVYENGTSTLGQVYSDVENGEDGAFTLRGLPPGRYYLKADVADEVIDTENLVYVDTYYPGTEHASGAVPLELTAEHDIRNIVTPLRQTRVFEVRGRLTNPLDHKPVDAEVALIPLESTDFSQRRTAPSRAGQFQLAGVFPGRYLLQAYPVQRSREEPAFFGEIELVVSKHDLEDVEIRMAPMAAVTGSVMMEQTDGKFRPASMANYGTIFLLAVGRPQVGNFSSQLAGGQLRIPVVPPGTYRILVTGFNSYFKSARIGAQEVGRGSFALTPGGTTSIEIVLSEGGGEIRGAVRDNDGKPVMNVSVSAWLPGRAADGSEDMTRPVVTGSNGEYRIPNLGPGRYSVLAWEQIEAGLDGVRAFRSKFVTEATTVEMKEGGQLTFDPPLIPRSQIDQEAAKLP